MKSPRVEFGAVRRSKGPSSLFERQVTPLSAETADQTSVPNPGPNVALRRSYQVAPSLPSRATAIAGKNGWTASWTRIVGWLQVTPPSAELLTQMVEVPLRWFSNHVTYSRPPPAAAEISWPIDLIGVPRSGSLVIVNVKVPTVTGCDQVSPPSTEYAAATLIRSPSRASPPSTNMSTSRASGSASSRLFCDAPPPLKTLTGCLQVAPPSSLREKPMSLDREPVVNLAHTA